jgi:hypothetical protein
MVVPIDVAFDEAVRLERGLVFSDVVARRMRVQDTFTYQVPLHM